MAPIFTYGILMNFNQENLKNITTNNKGTKASWNILRKATSIIKRDISCNFINIAHKSSLRNWYAINC